jgi:thiamine-monophosphate kinase
MGEDGMNGTSNLGERKIIEIIQRRLEFMPGMPVPFGDDVSAVEIGRGMMAVLKADMLVSKTDIPLGMNYWHAARKSVVMNVSDFAAKGVRPQALLVSIGLPRGMEKKNIQQIADGLNAGAREYGAYVIGGDTGEASDLVIAISLFGKIARNRIILRSGAQPGDILAVTGSFGKSSAGLRIIMQGIATPRKARQDLVESVMMPHARLNEGLALARTRAVSSAIDSSDGLAWSLHEIARSSHVGFRVDELPIADNVIRFAQSINADPFDLALYGGEEYEIILTVKPSMWHIAERAVARVGGKLIRVGMATAEKGVVLKANGKKRKIEPRGYEHFKDVHVAP